MIQIPRPGLALARSQHGLVTLEQLAAAGVTARTRSRLLTGGQLVPVAQGVSRIASHPVTFEQRCLGALLAAPSAALSGPSAGRIFGLRRCTTDDVHLLARNTVTLDGVVAHRTTLLRPTDITTVGAFRLLRPARLICDLAVYLSDDDLDSVIEQVLERRMASMSLIRAVANEFTAPGRNGTKRLRRVLNGRAGWTRPGESDLERRLCRALADRSLDVVPQFDVELDGGRHVRLDLALPAVRLAVEVDHATWHAGRLDVERDKRRDRQLTRLGWTVVRVTDRDIESRLEETVDEIVMIARRLESAAS